MQPGMTVRQMKIKTGNQVSQKIVLLYYLIALLLNMVLNQLEKGENCHH